MHVRVFLTVPPLALLALLASSAARPAEPVGLIAGPVDFDRDIKPILEGRCWECHGESKRRGGLRLDSREELLEGGDSGPAAIAGDSGDSLLIQLVSGDDPERVMPDEGPRLAKDDIALLAAWIDQGIPWGESSRPHAARYELALRRVPLVGAGHPIDQILDAYWSERQVTPGPLVDDAAFARRAYLDIIGVPPTPIELRAFLVDASSDKHARLASSLLSDRRRYAEHWLSFWNDALRNDDAGTGYIDGGRATITEWLFNALYDNMPYDRFASELVSPGSPASAGFTQGIVWRGVVNASQQPPMQAAQNVSQVFLGLNLKCASCHDSFISDWKLADAYGLAAVYADGPLEVSRCDNPTGVTAVARFLYPELGEIDPGAPRADRLARLSAILVKPEDGRFTRTIVNRLWARLFGRGIVEPTDEMDNEPWSADLLDFLASDLIEHRYDVKRTLELILTSRAYRTRAIAQNPGEPFAGPVVRRMSAEQFVDAVRSVAGVWPEKADAPVRVPGEDGPYPGPIRASMQIADPLMVALGRPNREQVVTSRSYSASTLQAIELTNGATLDALLLQGARRWVAEYPRSGGALVDAIYSRALGRAPSVAERREALVIVGEDPNSAGVQDFLWAIVMHPEFQLIH